MAKFTLKGQFLSSEQKTKKDGSTFWVTSVLSDNEVVQITNCKVEGKKLDPIEMVVDVRSGKYGLYITPVRI